jgi:uncharacterized protein (DUF2236 family)
MLALPFGTPSEHERALEGIRTIHRRVNGVLTETTGPFSAGTRYSAEDPELVLWIHLTLLESLPLTYELLVGPLTADERDAYCAEAAPVAIALCARESDVPRTWDEARGSIERMRLSSRLTVSEQARTLARSVLSPPGSWALAPATMINRLVTAGLLPPDLRAQYGLRWTPHDQRAFDGLVPLLRNTRRILPDIVALWPEARRFTEPQIANP